MRASPRLAPQTAVHKTNSLTVLTFMVIALGVAAAIGGHPRVALPLVALLIFVLAAFLPIHWLAYGTVALSLGFRALAPTGGIFNFLPDAVVVLVCARAISIGTMRKGRALSVPMKRLLVTVVAMIVLAGASTLLNRDSPLAYLGFIREFLRFPIWALCVCVIGLSADQARNLLRVLLLFSL